MARKPDRPRAEVPLADLTAKERALLRQCAALRAIGREWDDVAASVQYGAGQSDPGDNLEKWCRRTRALGWREALEEAEEEAVARCHQLWDKVLKTDGEERRDQLAAARDCAADIRRAQEIRQRREVQKIEDVSSRDPFADLRGQGLEEAAQRADRTLRLVEGASGHA